MAQPFDSTRLEFLGGPSPIVAADRVFNQLGFSASDTGVLTYSIVERPLTQFQWVGRAGEPQQLVADPGVYYTFDLSADSSRLVYEDRARPPHQPVGLRLGSRDFATSDP